MRLAVLFSSVLAGTTLAGCGTFSKDSKSSNGSPSSNSGAGCVQGVVLDGRSQERVKLPAHNRNTRTGIFVLLRNEIIAASPATSNQENDRLDGEYTLCGIPLDETLPIFAWIDGYEPFQSHIHIDSKHLHKFKQSIEDATEDSQSEFEGTLEDRSVPTLLANMRLFKSGEHAKDLSFAVRNHGSPVGGARVELRPVSFDSAYDDKRNINSSYFLTPSPERVKKIIAKTGPDGIATFAANNLVIGATYEYFVYGDDSGATYVWESGELTVGLLPLRGSESPSSPYRINVDITDTTPELKLIATSTQHQTYTESGEVKLYFNRPVEIVPGTLDNITASLANVTRAELTDEASGNAQAERVAISVNGHVVTLNPVYKSGLAPDKLTEAGATLTYSGLSLRPAQNALKSLTVWNAEESGGIEVRLFGGVTLPPNN